MWEDVFICEGRVNASNVAVVVFKTHYVSSLTDIFPWIIKMHQMSSSLLVVLPLVPLCQESAHDRCTTTPVLKSDYILCTYFKPIVISISQRLQLPDVIPRLTELWRDALDNDKYVGTVAMDLSKAFDCMPLVFFLLNCIHMAYHQTPVYYYYSSI